jgi:hypothetical protein
MTSSLARVITSGVPKTRCARCGRSNPLAFILAESDDVMSAVPCRKNLRRMSSCRYVAHTRQLRPRADFGAIADRSRRVSDPCSRTVSVSQNVILRRIENGSVEPLPHHERRCLRLVGVGRLG